MKETCDSNIYDERKYFMKKITIKEFMVKELLLPEIFEQQNLKWDIGVDCENIERWSKMLPKLLDGPQRRMFTDREHLYCESFSNPAPHYAGKWCAKEAVVKAVLSYYEVDLRDVEILNEDSGKPYCVIHDPQFELMKPIIKVSITHTLDVAIAFAVAARIST